MYIVKLSEVIKENLENVGSKALNLSKLLNEKIHIPDGFVIKSNAFYKFLNDNNLKDNKDIDIDFEDKFTSLAVPYEIENELDVYFQELCKGLCKDDISFAVRSSSAAEDLPEASFAGQYDTFLNIKSFYDLVENVKACWKSSFSERVRKYGSYNTIEVKTVPMAVFVQAMIDADVSGVIFSMNPVKGDKSEIVINASYGLGEAVVSGLVTPDTFFVNKLNNSIHKILGEKEIKIVSDVNGTKELSNVYKERKRFSLSDEQVINLAHQTKIIENFYKHAVDIEFAIKNGKIYILQARAITTNGG